MGYGEMMQTGNIRARCGKGVVVFLLAAAAASAQESSDPVQKAIDLEIQTGPAVADYGPVFTIDPHDVAFAPSPDVELKAVFEISIGAEGRDKADVSIMNVARFVNMHARAGMPKDKLKAAMVVHGGGTWEVLNNEAYRKRFGMDNPNLPALEQLAAAGVDVYVCAQSAAGRQILWKEFASPTVKLAFSAMTAIVSLQNDGYQFISHDWPRPSLR